MTIVFRPNFSASREIQRIARNSAHRANFQRIAPTSVQRPYALGPLSSSQLLHSAPSPRWPWPATSDTAWLARLTAT